MSDSIFAKTTLYDEIVLAILTPAGISNIQSKSEITWIGALWDTGASMSCISDRLAKQLGLIEFGFLQMGTASGFQKVPYYIVSLHLTEKKEFNPCIVGEFTYIEDGCDLIIGMDVISQGDFALSRRDGATLFSFRIPSIGSLDFEEET